MKTAIVWLRRDLRLADNPALCRAARAHDRVIPLYIHCPASEGEGAAGAASRVWLHHSLRVLSQEFENHGTSLVFKQGDPKQILSALCRAHDVTSVIWSAVYEPAIARRDAAIKAALAGIGVTVEELPGSLIVPPAEAVKDDGTPYKVFSPFWKRIGRPALEALPPPLSVPTLADHGIRGEQLEGLGLLPDHGWYRKFDGLWTPGAAGAAARLDDFIETGLARYKAERDVPAAPATSRLSAHLHWGEITPNQIVHAVKAAGPLTAPAEKFFSELGWRDFGHLLLHHFPHTLTEPLNPRFADFPWVEGDAARDRLAAWQRGETGFSLVDAGMQELWQTGTMHNRVRMVTASLLVKNLGIHWREGGAWFWDTLLDADLANNTLGWQWVAGSGADAAPYFRIFNPESQADKFDSKGEYRKRFLGPQWLTREVKPVIDLKKSREAALAAYQQIKG